MDAAEPSPESQFDHLRTSKKKKISPTKEIHSDATRSAAPTSILSSETVCSPIVVPDLATKQLARRLPIEISSFEERERGGRKGVRFGRATICERERERRWRRRDGTFGEGFVEEEKERMVSRWAYRRECNGDKSSGVSEGRSSGVLVVVAMNKDFGIPPRSGGKR